MDDAELVRLLRNMNEYEPLGHDGWKAADRIEALISERDALKAARVKIKPLVWDWWDGGMTAATTPWGKYNLNPDLRLSFPTGAYRRYETEVCAKAAAQADYEARVLSALGLTPDPAAQALVEAARDLMSALHATRGTGRITQPVENALDRIDAALATFEEGRA